MTLRGNKCKLWGTSWIDFLIFSPWLFALAAIWYSVIILLSTHNNQLYCKFFSAYIIIFLRTESDWEYQFLQPPHNWLSSKNGPERPTARPVHSCALISQLILLWFYGGQFNLGWRGRIWIMIQQRNVETGDQLFCQEPFLTHEGWYFYQSLSKIHKIMRKNLKGWALARLHFHFFYLLY